MEDDEETSFDDVAMSLLLFFLVLSIFTNAAPLYLLKQVTDVPTPSATKKKKTHGDYDVAIHVDAGNNIQVQHIGGKAKYAKKSAPINITLRADDEEMLPEGGEIPATETADASIELKNVLVKYLRAVKDKKHKRPPKIYFSAASVATLGVVHSVRYGVWMARRDVPSKVRAKMVPCPPLDTPQVVQKVSDFNLCIETSKSISKCQKRIDMKKKDLKVRFCDMAKLTAS